MRILELCHGEEEEVRRVLNGRQFLSGFEQAIMTMSLGEMAEITVSRELLHYGDYPDFSVAYEEEESRTAVFTLLSID